MEKPRLNSLFFKRQQGAVLLLMTLVLAVSATAFAFKALNQSNVQIEREKITLNALTEAKAAVIGWSVSHPNLPGSMPFPDRNGDGNYDGNSDCYTGTFNYSFLLGQLPWLGQTNPCTALPLTGFGVDVRDGSGNRLWYAVSRNLVHDYQTGTDPIINPGIITSPTYNWMTVYDKRGNLISNRVAVVIIAPGAIVGAQDRSAAAPNASEYLDSFYLAAGGGIKSNTGYTLPDEDFYMGEDMRNVPESDTTYQHPYYFNDKLVYITIDELMAEVEKRAATEAKNVLNSYNTTNGFFPYAAPLANPLTHSCQTSTLSGLLPTATSASTSCTCASNVNCTCAFSKITNVQYIRTSPTATWTSNTGSCSRSGVTCTCTGAGSCTRTTRTFSCTSAGVCTLSGGASGSYKFNGVFTSPAAQVNTRTGSCTLGSCGAVTCTGSGTFSYTPCSDLALPTYPAANSLPSWFTTNNWQDYLYYSLARPTPTMTAGSRTGLTALLIATGAPITASPFAVKGSAQTRPSTSCNVNDYLDSAQNTNGDTTFDAPNLSKSSSYNDRTFIVAP